MSSPSPRTSTEASLSCHLCVLCLREPVGMEATFSKAALCVPSRHKPHGLCSRHEGWGRGCQHSRDIWPGELTRGHEGQRGAFSFGLGASQGSLRNNHRWSLREDGRADQWGSAHNSSLLVRLCPTLSPNRAQRLKQTNLGLSPSSSTRQLRGPGQLTQRLPVGW